MSLITAHFRSETLSKQVQLLALIPDHAKPPFPVLYLLHGLSDDATIWLRMTRLELLLRNWPLIVVMPDGFRSFYTNHTHGPAYGDYITQDVLGFVERNLPAKPARSARAIGGLSMGGYGALRLALSHPNLFTSAHSHSGALLCGTDPWKRDLFKQSRPEFLSVFGKNPAGTHHDLLHLSKQFASPAARKTLPHLRLDCGHDDFLLQESRTFVKHLQKLNIPHDYTEHPGDHNWHYWDTHIAHAIAWHAKHLKISPL